MVTRKITILVITFATMLMAAQSAAQSNKSLSPKEVIETTLDGIKTKIIYCRPSARGRKIMGKLVPYGEVWRTGANEATSIEFEKSVKIEGKDLPAGKYALFTIPNENEWIVIFNKNYDQIGAFNYSQREDVLRVNVKPTKTDKFTETFTISSQNGQVNMDWENTHVDFKIKGK